MLKEEYNKAFAMLLYKEMFNYSALLKGTEPKH